MEASAIRLEPFFFGAEMESCGVSLAHACVRAGRPHNSRRDGGATVQLVANLVALRAGSTIESGGVMRRTYFVFALALLIGLTGMISAAGAQESKPSGDSAKSNAPTQADTNDGRAYSGMYTFLKEGEFVQISVQDAGHVSGFVSRFGDGESDKGAFLDQFFKNGKLEGNKLSFTTEVVHGVTFDFKGTIERGEGKNPGDEAYFVLKGTLTESASDVNKKVTAHSKEVLFKMFPQNASPEAIQRK
jgi:hypothetical protein